MTDEPKKKKSSDHDKQALELLEKENKRLREENAELAKANR